MKSINPKPEIKKLTVQSSGINDGDTDVPLDYPIVIKFDNDIEVVDNSKIILKSSEKSYAVKSSVYNGMLVIEHEDLSYDSNFTLNIGAGAVNDSVNTLYNDQYNISFNTGKEFNRIQGINRYETSISVSKKWPSSEYVVLASGQGFADALSGSALAALSGSPIILMDEGMADKTDIINGLVNLKENVKMKRIIGGEAAVPPAVLDKIFK